jgi:hypothetical protein
MANDCAIGDASATPVPRVESSGLARAMIRLGARAIVSIFVLMSPKMLGSVAAQPELYASTASCAALQGAVNQNGSAVIHTAPYLYDRYVTWCSRGQVSFPAYLRVRDNPQCFVGYSCKQGGH